MALKAYTNGLALIRALVPVVKQLAAYDRDLADQVRRAAQSITLNVGEGRCRTGLDQKRFYRMAHGSAGEIEAALDTAIAWGWRIEFGNTRAILEEELRLLHGLHAK